MKGCDFEFVLANWADCTVRYTQISMHNAELRAKTVGMGAVLEPDFSAHAVMCKHSAQWRGQAWVCVCWCQGGSTAEQEAQHGAACSYSAHLQRRQSRMAWALRQYAAARQLHTRLTAPTPCSPDGHAAHACSLPASRGRRRSQCRQWRRMPRRKCARWRAQSHLCPPAAGYIRRFEHICV